MRAAACLLAAAALAWATTAAADGGLVRISQPAGPFVVTVFSAPTPLRAGPVDLSVLVQEPGGAAVLDAEVRLILERRGERPTPIELAATRAQATNKLLYAAPFELPAAGTWQVEVTVARGADRATVAFAVDAAPPLPPWRAYWPYFALPAVGAALLALREWLVLRR
jgi:hypothetical protein